MDSSYGRTRVAGPAPVGQGYGGMGGAAPLVELAMRALGGGSRATYNPPVSEEAAAALGAVRRPATGSKPMRDYLGKEVQGAMEVIRALAPPPAPVAALGAPKQRKRGGGLIRGPGDGRSDSVPGVALGGGPAMDAVAVSDGEYVIPADAVSALGRGSSDAGARKLDQMVEQTRTGYRAHLGKIPGPKKGGKGKFLGGLLESSQESEIVQPDWARDLGGAGRNILLNGIGKRTGQDSVAQFTPDQLAAFDMSRGIATGDPGGVQGNIAQMRQGVMNQRQRVGGAQDYLSDVFSDGGWSDKLVSDSLADFDYGRAKDAAATQRLRAGRGAFGDRRAIAEDEESTAASLARAKLGSSLREQGINTRMNAANSLGGLARTSGDLANLGAGLSTSLRDVQVGNAGMLNQVGGQIQGRNQQVLDNPYKVVDAYRGFMSGAPSTTSTTSQQSPLQAGLGLAMMAGGMMLRDGGKVRLGRGKKGCYADGGAVAMEDPRAMRLRRLAAINGGRGMQLAFADGGMIGEDVPEFPEPGWLGAKLGMRPLFTETVPDALGMNYQGPDPDGAGGRPSALELRYIKARPQNAAVDTGESAPVAAPAKTSVADKVKAVLGSGAPKPKARAPMADATRAAPPIPASRPEQKQAAALGNFMPEMKTRGPEPASAAADVAATEGGAGEGGKTGGFNWEDKLTSPLFMAGLAMLASENKSVAGALGEAGLTAARSVGERRRQERADAELARREARDDRKLGIDEKQLEATLGNQAAIAADREADNARLEAALGIQRERAGADAAYKNARLGQMAEGLGIQRANLKRLQEAGLAGGTKTDPLNRALINSYAAKLADAEASGDTETADAIRQQLYAIGALGGGDALGSLPPGFEMDEE